MAKPATLDIEVYKGDDFSVFFRVRELNQDQTPGAYVNLTGGTGKAQVRQTEDNANVEAEFTVTLSNQTTTPGGVLCELSSAQTSAFAFTTGVWDVQVTGADSKVKTYLKGKVTVIKEVTRV